MHAFSHQLSHRGHTASRVRARWQPYAAIPPIPARSSPSNAYINTPPFVPTPASLPQHPLSEPERIVPHASSLLHRTREGTFRDAHKARYVNDLVDVAVNSLCEIWPLRDIPAVFVAAATPPLCQSLPTSSFNAQIRSNTQLPSPPVSPNHLASPMPTANTSPPPPVNMSNVLSTSNGDISSHNTASLRRFVHEVLRRSRTSCSVLQTALCYLEAIRTKVPELVGQEHAGHGVRGEVDQSDRVIGADDPSLQEAVEDVILDDCPNPTSCSYVEDDMAPPTVCVRDSTPPCAAPSISQNARDAFRSKKPRQDDLPILPPLPSPLLCPRRVFLASLILASKFTQDKCCSNRAWARLAGLPVREIGRCERALGEALEWRLWVGKLPPQRAAVSRSRSEGSLFAESSSVGVSVDAMTSGSTPGVATPQSSHDLRRSSTLPANAFQPQHPPEGVMPPAPPPHPSCSSAPFSTVHDPWMPIPPPTPLAAPFGVSTPVRPSTWAYAAPSLFEAEPTPTLSMSPTVTEYSSGEDLSARTIQMHSFVDTPSPVTLKLSEREPAYAAYSSVGGFLSEGGIVPPYTGGYDVGPGWVYADM